MLVIDPTSFSVTCRGREVRLTRKEFMLLDELAHNSGRVMTREVLLDRVWDMSYYGYSRTLDGDAMGTAYRDAGRIVAKSTNNRFREGFFDDLQEMDEMPVTGMVMTYALDRVFTAEPTFYVIMGGGKERFVSRTASNSGDTRNLAAELHMNMAYDKLGLSHLRARQE